MRVKKYKRVRRPKIHVQLPGGSAPEDGDEDEQPNGGDRTSDHAANNGPELHMDGDKVAAARPEESDSNTTGERREASHLLLETEGCQAPAANAAKTERARKGSVGKVKSIEGAGGAVGDRRESALVWPEGSTVGDEKVESGQQLPPQPTAKNGNQFFSDDGKDAHGPAEGGVDGEAAVVRLAARGSVSTPKEGSDERGGAGTPRTSKCSEADADPTSVDLKRVDDDDEDEYEEYEEDDETDDEGEESGGPLAGGSLWFKAERVVIFLQLLALALDVHGAEWPSLFLRMWDWVWITNQYLRWPLLVLLQRVGGEFSLTFGDAELELWFFRDVIGYGVEICAAAVAVFVLFFVLQMPDYTSQKPREAWRRSFLTHWFRRTLPRYVVNLVLSYVALGALTHYGDTFFPPDVVTAAIVVGGTLLTISWLSVVALSLLVHLHVRIATKHDAEYSFMIAMVSGNWGSRTVLGAARVWCTRRAGSGGICAQPIESRQAQAELVRRGCRRFCVFCSCRRRGLRNGGWIVIFFARLTLFAPTSRGLHRQHKPAPSILFYFTCTIVRSRRQCSCRRNTW